MITITVTAAEEAEGSRGRFLITLKLSDDVHEETKTIMIFRYFLREKPFCGTVPAVGEFLSAEDYDALMYAGECSRAAVKAVSFLAYGDNTAKKLSEKLRTKGFSKEASTAAVRFCVEKRYIREEEQLARLMEVLCTQKKYGARRIRQEIWNKGFSEETVKAVWEDILETLDFDSALDDRIRKLGRSAFSPPDKKKRTVSSLLRYGFSFDEINRAVRRVYGSLPEKEEEWGDGEDFE